MSERYGKCKFCGGMGFVLKKDLVLHRTEKKDCGACDTTGFDGSIAAYNAMMEKKQAEQDEWNRLLYGR